MTPQILNLRELSAELFGQNLKGVVGLLQFALPDRYNIPARFLKGIFSAPVSFNVPLKLLSPKFGSSFWKLGKSAICVLMPEASMDKNTGLQSGQYDVGATRQVSAVQPETEAVSVQKPPNQHFRFGVLAFDAGHHS
jgi:hypothetical protein